MLSHIFKFNLSTRLFWGIFAILTLALIIDTSHRYNETKDMIKLRGFNEARALDDYFISMRYVYHQQFLKSGIDLNDSTLGFLPAHAASLISDKYAQITSQGISVRNVSDRPRNPKNLADTFEMKAIHYFKTHPEKTELEQTIVQNNKTYLFYSSPLKIVPYCLACHGKKEETLAYVKNRYTTAFGYKVGDIRGINSIKVLRLPLQKSMMKIFFSTTIINFGVSFLFLALLYFIIKKLTLRETQITKELEEMVKTKTIKIQKAYLHEKHLRSVLSTVADVNKILITATSITELIDLAALTLSQNKTFLSVKISLEQNGNLESLVSYAPWDEKIVTAIDKEVFASNQTLLMHTLKNKNIPPFYEEKIKEHDIKAIYAVALKSNSFVEKPLGVLLISTTLEDGFNDDNIAMVDELAGDIGFAINSFMQKDHIELLNDEKFTSYQEFIEALVQLIEQRDTYTAGHTKRVAKYASMIATELDLPQEDIKNLVEAAKLHDIGKVVIPDSILLNPSSLTSAEYALIQDHAIIGYNVLSKIASYKGLAEIVLTHHERFDGTGYPYGKKGDEIPLTGHILALADSFDAMTTNRIYKPRKSVAVAIDEIQTLSGKQFHPEVAATAVKVLSKVEIDESFNQLIALSDIEKERLSYFFQDRLTKLYNKEYLSLVISGRSGHPSPTTLTFISLINFTQYNKTYTWEGGDELLVEFANFLTKELQGYLLFRIWGDHFVIADYNLDIDALIASSSLAKNNIDYKIKRIEAPFKEI